MSANIYRFIYGPIHGTDKFEVVRMKNPQGFGVPKRLDTGARMCVCDREDEAQYIAEALSAYTNKSPLDNP